MSEPDDSDVSEPQGTTPDEAGLAGMFPSRATEPRSDDPVDGEPPNVDAGKPGLGDTQLTEPLQPPVGPPVDTVGAAPNTSDPTASDDGAARGNGPQPGPQQWVPQAAFDKERRKSRIFMGTTVVAAALLAGALFYAVAQGQQSAVPIAGPGSAQGGGPTDDRGFDRRGPGQIPGERDRDGNGPGSRGGPGGLLDRFFDSDGSLDEDAIAELQRRLEDFGGSGLTERLARGLEAAVASGAITQEQADQLLAVLGEASTGADA